MTSKIGPGDRESRIYSMDGDMVSSLRRTNHDLSEALRRLIEFQHRSQAIRRAPGIEEAIDELETLLDEAIDFSFGTLFCWDGDGKVHIARSLAPSGLTVDEPLLEWTRKSMEVSLVPVEYVVDEVEIRSMLLFRVSSRHVGVIWMREDPSNFTQEQAAILGILSRETNAALEAHFHRENMENARAIMYDIIESLPHALLALDSKGRLSMINGTAEIAFSVRRGDALGKSYEQTLPPEINAFLTRLFKEGAEDERELTLNHGGVEQVLGFTVSPIHAMSAESPGKLVICRDLRLSKEVRKLRELDAMKDDFLSLVSHELRTPLTAIVSCSDVLLMNGMIETPEERNEYLNVINEEGKRLGRLIEDILDLTKMEAGKMAYDFSNQDPNDVVGTVVMAMNSLAEAKHQTIELDLQPDIGAVRLAIDRMTQVLTNLLSNAIKYTQDGGRIVITTRREEPFPDSIVPTVLFIVEDNGVGIAKENLDRVFSKFEQITAVSHHSSGTGLGMSICKQIVEDGHNGKIWIDSAVGVGTKVFVRIPVF